MLAGMAFFNQVFAQSDPRAIFLDDMTHRHLLGELDGRMTEISVNGSGSWGARRGILRDRAGEMRRPTLFQLERECHRHKAGLTITRPIAINPAPDAGGLFSFTRQRLTVQRTDRDLVRIFLAAIGTLFHVIKFPR